MTDTDMRAAADPNQTMIEMLSRPFGGSGVERISDTTLRSGRKIFWIQILEDAVFETLTPITGFTSTGMTGVTWSAGSTIAGRYSAVKLTSGTITINTLE